MQLVDEVVALALEALVRSSPDVDVEVPVAAAPGPDRAEAAEAQGRPGVDPGRDVDRVGLLLDASSLAPAVGARLRDDLAEAAAAGARRRGDHLAEDRLADPAHLAGAAALGARLRVGARRRAAGLAGVARDRGAHRHRRLGAEHGLLEVDVDRHLEVAAPGRAADRLARRHRSRRPPPPKNASKMSPTPPPNPNGSPAAGLRALGPEHVVAAALLGVAQHLVGLGDLLEPGLGAGVAGVGVGVELAGPAAGRPA